MKINLSSPRTQVAGFLILLLLCCSGISIVAIGWARTTFDRQIMLLLTPEPHFPWELYLINADGSGQIRLTNNLALEGEHIWSPNGQQIAFVLRPNHGWCQIHVMNIDGGQLVNLTQNLESCERSPVWSPDGQRIAFVSEGDGNPEIYTVHVDGTQRTRLTHHPAEDEDPVWSPDGQRLAFVSLRDDNWEIYIMNADGSQQTNLTNNPATDWTPVWSPDGQQLAFTSIRDGNKEIYVMNADGSQQINITNSPSTWEDYARWSPDGQIVGFRSDRQESEAIYVAYADGSPPGDALKENAAFKAAPIWSPDGRRIAFQVFVYNEDSGGQTGINLIDTDGRWETPLNPTGVSRVGEPVWSPDGKSLLFTAEPTEN